MLLLCGATTRFSSSLFVTGKAIRMNVVVPSQTPSMPLAADDDFGTLGQSAEFSHRCLCSKELERGIERCDCLFL